MLTGYSPFHGADEDELFRNIQFASVKYPKDLSEESIACVKAFLERDPIKRLGMESSAYGSIKNHRFFRSINWQKLENRQIQPPFIPSVVSLNY
jgi:serine/threonine protein kinase